MEGFKQNFENFLKDTSDNKTFEDKRYYLNKETQDGILEIQKQKENIMDQMRGLLKKVDSHEEIAFHQYGRSIILEDGKMYFFKKGGVKEEATKGDIMVAGINGFDLKLNKDIDRTIKKEFILQETRRKIRELYNNQLISAELENKNNSPSDGVIGAFKEISKSKNMKVYENRQSGILAETMVESYLTKLFADNPELPFTIEIADVYDDVRRKMDFKLHIKKEYTRGVKITTHTNTGIQFTMNTRKTDLKEKQIKRSKEQMNQLDKKPVDDLVLVTLSINEIQKSLENWKKQGKNKSIAGPAEHWNKETQKLVFTKMLEKLPKSLDINSEELWNAIQK